MIAQGTLLLAAWPRTHQRYQVHVLVLLPVIQLLCRQDTHTDAVGQTEPPTARARAIATYQSTAAHTRSRRGSFVSMRRHNARRMDGQTDRGVRGATHLADSLLRTSKHRQQQDKVSRRPRQSSQQSGHSGG